MVNLNKKRISREVSLVYERYTKMIILHIFGNVIYCGTLPTLLLLLFDSVLLKTQNRYMIGLNIINYADDYIDVQNVVSLS